MIDDGGYLDILLMRLLGGLGGSLIAIVIVQPETIAGLFKRLLVSLSSSTMLTPILTDYLDWDDDADSVIAASCIVAAVAWWVWHSLIRAAQAGYFPWRKNNDGA